MSCYSLIFLPFLDTKTPRAGKAGLRVGIEVVSISFENQLISKISFFFFSIIHMMPKSFPSSIRPGIYFAPICPIQLLIVLEDTPNSFAILAI